MRNRMLDLESAVAGAVGDGDTIFVGGFGQCVPFASAHEIIRQKRKNLVLCRSGADIVFDLMIAANCVMKVIVGYLGNPGVGLAHAFRRAAEAGDIEIEDWTNFSMIQRLHAGALGVPFIPTATLVGGDLPKNIDVRPVTCPYTGETMMAVPALRPDVALVHAQFADAEGNVQLYGLPGDTIEGALASERIVVTVERIVSADVIRRSPERTILPGFRVASVTEVPWGAHPSYVDGFYGRDDDAYLEWNEFARDPVHLADWIAAEVNGVPDFAAHVKRLDPERLTRLHAERGRDLTGVK